MAFESQRRFVANASHELRTPITVSRTLIEVALADPDCDVESLRTTCQRVLASGEQQERTIEALLTLARSQRGIEAQEPLDLAEVAAEVVRGAHPDGAPGVAIELALQPAEALGDPALIERMTANLVDNALVHNTPDGFVRVQTQSVAGRATLRVSNSGPVIAPERVPALFEPFRRLEGRRTADGRGLGLGLSIVDAIASVHGARLEASSRPHGGLEVEVSFPTSLPGNGRGHVPPPL
jgi:signal transduction histidine kinase